MRVRPRGLWLKPLAKRLEIIGGCLPPVVHLMLTGFCPWHGFRVSGFGAPAGGGFWVSDLPQGLGFGFRVLGTAGGQILESELSKNREISSWSVEAELQLSFIFAKKIPAEHLHISDTSDSDVRFG